MEGQFTTQRVSLDAHNMLGLSVCTNNQLEASTAHAKIAPLWQRFFETSQHSEMLNSPMYGAYFDYVSDMDGDYSVMVGKVVPTKVSQTHFDALTLEAGCYRKFAAHGPMPQCVIDLWTQIWQYFSAADCTEKRRYLTDFEVYLSATEVEIYIGVWE